VTNKTSAEDVLGEKQVLISMAEFISNSEGREQINRLIKAVEKQVAEEILEIIEGHQGDNCLSNKE
jgi:hypothetical protein